MRQVGRLGGLALAALFVFGGCDGPPPASSSTTTATVKGTVTLKGKPLPKVEVMFNPANVNRKTAPAVTTKAGDNGAYELSTLIGDNIVTLVGPVALKNPALSSFNKSYDVKSGENTVDITIP